MFDCIVFLNFSDENDSAPMLSEDDIIRGRNARYGRRRSTSIDYGSRGSSSHEFEQSPEQALVSRSQQLLRTIPRFQYEALSWIPNLLKVQDTQAEINAEVYHCCDVHSRKLSIMNMR